MIGDIYLLYPLIIDDIIKLGKLSLGNFGNSYLGKFCLITKKTERTLEF